VVFLKNNAYQFIQVTSASNGTTGTGLSPSPPEGGTAQIPIKFVRMIRVLPEGEDEIFQEGFQADANVMDLQQNNLSPTAVYRSRARVGSANSCGSTGKNTTKPFSENGWMD